jgi:hypothetical protein
MKKIIAIFVIALMAFTAPAQMLTTQLDKGVTYVNVGTDYTLTNTTAAYWQVNAQSDYMTAQDVIVHLDSASGNHTNVALAIYGRKSAQTSTWTAIGSPINWKGTTIDTTIIFSNTTENGYRQYKILFTGTGTGTTTIANMELKLWYGIP